MPSLTNLHNASLIILTGLSLSFGLYSVTASAAGDLHQVEFCLGFESEELVRVGEVVVTDLDFDALMSEIPDEDRTQYVANRERIANALESQVLQRGIARDALTDGLLEDDSLLSARIYERIVALIAEIQADRYVNEHTLDDYSERGRELFLTNPERFREPRRFSFSHILVQTSERGETEAMRLILQLRDRAEAGESFKDLVAEYSDDPAKEDNAGFYEAMRPDQLDRNFGRRLGQLTETGELSEPVRSNFGWHIIRLEEIHEAGVPEWEAVADQARQLARQRHRERLRSRYFSDVLTAAEVQVAPGVIERLQRRYGFDPERGRPAD
jgi:peptidyl-prolyl cis-trans isomerase C